MGIRELIKVTGLPAVVASLCCLSPLVLVFFGLSGIAFGSSLADVLYGQYKWIFRVLGLVFLLISIGIYFWKEKGICSLSEIKRRRREIINKTILFIIVGIFAYIFFLYVIIHYAGVLLGIWENYS